MRLVKTKAQWEGRAYEETSVIEDKKLSGWGHETRLNVVGKSHPRIDGAERVTGRAKYTFDITLPGMLYAKVLRSPHAHARTKSIDISRAAVLPGVRGIISRLNATDAELHGEPVFSDVLRFYGDEIAAVAADDEDIAEDAVKLIDVTFDVLPFVSDAEKALSPGAPKVQPYGNLMGGEPKPYNRGDTERGFSEADAIVEATFHTQSALHNCLESHGAVASWKGDKLTVWETTQAIHRVQDDLVEAFHLPYRKVRVKCEYMGGGFGSKQNSGKWSVIAARLARETGRPVHLMWDRQEENLAAGHRAPTVQHLKMGAKKDGTLTAIELTAMVNIGAYETGGGARPCDGPVQSMYACPNVHTEVRSVFTNTPVHRSFRGPGYVEGAFPLESMMDELAKKFNIDPIEFRMKNYAQQDPRSGQKYSAKYLDECYERGAKMTGWDKRGASGTVNGDKRRGLGMASQVWGGGGEPPAFAWVKMGSNGTVEVITGSQDIGTGTRTAYAQIAAEELGMEPNDIIVRIGDTENAPYDPVSWGSMSVSSVGPAIRQAAVDAHSQLYQIIADYYGVTPEKVKIHNGNITIPGKRAAALKDMFEEIGEFTIIGKGAREPNPTDVDVRTFGAQFAEVEVDTATGEVNVLKLVTVHDIGRIANPLTASNQAHGAVVQGIGYGLMENRVIDQQTGVVLNANMEDYHLPTALDFNEIGYDFIGEPDTLANNLGIKGMGEPAMIPTAPAIANAIANAIGVRFLSIPITRDKILEALQEKQENGMYP